MELSIGDEVILTSDEGGVLAGVVDRFERDGNVAIIMPTDPVMKAWYPKGYDLGRAHWDSRLNVIDYRKEAGENGPQTRTGA
jgi:hypothetical protein